MAARQLRDIESARLPLAIQAIHQRFQHQLSGQTEHIAQHIADLHVGVFQHFLNPVAPWAAMPIICLRRRVKSRSSRIGRAGMKLGRIMPWRNRCASQRASCGSVLCPVTALTCCGFAKMIFSEYCGSSSRTLSTGFQYTPVLSITTCVQPSDCSHARSISSSWRTVLLELGDHLLDVHGPVLTVSRGLSGVPARFYQGITPGSLTYRRMAYRRTY